METTPFRKKTPKKTIQHRSSHRFLSLPINQSKRKMESFKWLSAQYPKLIHHLLQELLKVEGYSEVVVGFGAGIDLDFMRKLSQGNIQCIPQKIFFDILGLYARVFCDWHHYRDIYS